MKPTDEQYAALKRYATIWHDTGIGADLAAVIARAKEADALEAELAEYRRNVEDTDNVN